MLDSNLLPAILSHYQRGFSVIPLLGGADAHEGKRPAVSWAAFQRARPSPNDLHNWFAFGKFSAYGVVCGLVSRLVVLDLDDERLAQAFLERFPQLAQTLRVASGTRGTPHLYWRAGFSVQTRTFRGADLKGEGGYVVGPGSRMADCAWRIVQNAPVRAITQDELAQVIAFLEDPRELVPAPDHDLDVGTQQAVSVRASAVFDESDAVALYRYLVAARGGRNQALFETACLARDRGRSQSWALKALVQVHAEQIDPQARTPEPYRRRCAEAISTINSVYSRAPRIRPADGLSRWPNSLREALLRRPDGVAVVRTVEGALLSGIAVGAAVSEPQLCRALKGTVSRRTIRKALAAVFDDGEPFFVALPPQAPRTPVDTGVADSGQKNAFLSGGQNESEVNPRHRPARLYRLPAAAALCAKLGIRPRGSSPLRREDLASSKQCRQALHVDFIRRAPGSYSQALLGQRLNLSTRTIRRYHQVLPVRVQRTFTEIRIQKDNLHLLPSAADIRRMLLPTGGRFLMDRTGRKYPAKREAAAYLVAKDVPVSYFIQGPNHYRYDETANARASNEIVQADGRAPLRSNQTPVRADGHPPLRPAALPDPAPELPGFVTRHIDRLPALVRTQPDPAAQRPGIAQEGRSDTISLWEGARDHVRAEKRESKRKFQKPLADAQAERLAQRLWHSPAGFTLPNARRLVDLYGVEAVEAALRKMLWLNARGKITNPAGFMVTASRVGWRARLGRTGPGDSAPAFHAEPKRRPRGQKVAAAG